MRGNLSSKFEYVLKGLGQILGLSWLYLYTKVKPKTWLRPFVNTDPGACKSEHSLNGKLTNTYNDNIMTY